jgi:hypothetical protein
VLLKGAVNCTKEIQKMRKITRLLFSGAFLLVLVLGMTSAAQATSITYNLTSDHCSGGCGPAGTIFGTVNLNDNGGTTVTVTVDLSNGYAYAKTGSVDFQSFLFNGIGVALGDITVAAHTPALTVTSGPYTGSGVGTFQFGIGCPTCGNGLSDAFTTNIVFTVANATIADLTTPAAGNGSNIFVADIGNLTTGATGPVDVSISVPEPTSFLLLGSGLLALGFASRRRIKG